MSAFKKVAKINDWLMGNGSALAWAPISERFIEDLSSGERPLLKDGLFGITVMLSKDPDYLQDKTFVTSFEVYKHLPIRLRNRASYYLYRKTKSQIRKTKNLLVIDFHTQIDGEGGHLPSISSKVPKDNCHIHLSVCGGGTPYMAPVFNKLAARFSSPKLLSQRDIESLPDAAEFNCSIIKNPLLHARSFYETLILEKNGVLNDDLPQGAKILEQYGLSPWVDFLIAEGGESKDMGLDEKSFLSAFKKRYDKGDMVAALNLLRARGPEL